MCIDTEPTEKPRRLAAILVLALVVVIPVLLLFVAPLALLAHDESHRISVQCEVQQSTVGAVSEKSLRGAGASGTQVVVSTTDCGKILLQNGITGSNARDVAKRLKPGDITRFELGEWTYGMRGLLRILDLSPAAYSYQTDS